MNRKFGSIPAPTQMPINNLLAGTQAPPLHPATTNPFLTIHGDNASQKVTVSVCALLQLVKYQNEFYWLIRDDCPAPLFLPTPLKIYYPPDNFFLKPVVSAPGYCKHKGPKPIYISSKYISLNLHIRLEDCFIISKWKCVLVWYGKWYWTVQSEDSSWCFENLCLTNLFNYRNSLDNLGIFLLFCSDMLKLNYIYNKINI